jgi:hypothetical protein
VLPRCLTHSRGTSYELVAPAAGTYDVPGESTDGAGASGYCRYGARVARPQYSSEHPRKDEDAVPASDSEGQVSEASSLKDADEPIQPDQAVAGPPAGEGGDVQEGKAGPNARTGGEESEYTDDDSSDQAATHD